MILPKFISKMIAILRGGVSPVIIFLSVILGFSFGLIPGFSGLHTAIVIVVLILNIHTGLFLISAALAKSLCFAAAPVLYYVGTWIQTNLSFIFDLLESIPLIGIMDFNRYSVAGAIVLGPILGAVAGLLMARSVIGFRRTLLKIEEGSDNFRKWYSNTWVRILDRLLIGKRTKDAKSLFTAKTKYIRKAGVALAVIVIIASLIAAHLIKDSTIKDYATKQMTRANGAEVDLEKLNLSILTGSFSASGLQVTDPEKRQNNQVSIDKVSADASLYSLLLGKLVLEQVELSDIKFDQQRTNPGDVPAKSETQEKPAIFDPRDFKLENIDLAKLDTYIKDAKALKEKLQKLRKWLPKSDDKKTETQAKQVPQKYLDYLKAKAAVPTTPRIIAKQAILDKVQLAWPVFGNSKILLTNLSDSPKNAKMPVTFEMTSNDTSASIKATIDFGSKEQTPGISGTFNGFDLAKIQPGLSNDAGLMFESGLASGKFGGTATNEFIDITLDIAVSNLNAKGRGKGVLGLGSDTTSQAFDALKELKTTIRVVGPVSEPRLVFDVKGLTEEFKNALVKAGQDRLAKEIDDKLGKKIDEKLGDKVPAEIKDALKKPDDLLKGIGDLLGGKKEEKK
ncbi:MAG: hypothetical protein JW837_11665 [Sedimentisphaerales bacterium]|nr:hypothetical protein [Sedimentisphaerales bacterium]